MQMPNNELINIANVLSERLNQNTPTSLADMVIENGQKKQLNYEIMFQLPPPATPHHTRHRRLTISNNLLF